jgi:hypothetical protein
MFNNNSTNTNQTNIFAMKQNEYIGKENNNERGSTISPNTINTQSPCFGNTGAFSEMPLNLVGTNNQQPRCNIDKPSFGASGPQPISSIDKHILFGSQHLGINSNGEKNSLFELNSQQPINSTDKATQFGKHLQTDSNIQFGGLPLLKPLNKQPNGKTLRRIDSNNLQHERKNPFVNPSSTSFLLFNNNNQLYDSCKPSLFGSNQVPKIQDNQINQIGNEIESIQEDEENDDDNDDDSITFTFVLNKKLLKNKNKIKFVVKLDN